LCRAAANKDLFEKMKGRPKEEFDIETLTPGNENHVEMDLFAG
jgi:hypothetical protein